MTVVAGYANGKNVWIAADSLSANSHSGTESAQAKVFRVRAPVPASGGRWEEVLFGGTTSWRFLQLLQYRLRLPPIPGDVNPDVYAATSLSDAVRACLKTHGWPEKEGGFALVGLRGRLYVLQSGYDVTRPAQGYAAVGAGEDIALGALGAFAFSFSGAYEPAEVVRRAVEVACAHSPWCSEPIRLEVL